MTYIILAAIGLIVFVVIVAIFANNSMQTADGIDDQTKCLCSDLVGKTADSGGTISQARCLATDPNDGSYVYPECDDYIDCSDTQKCYVKWSGVST